VNVVVHHVLEVQYFGRFQSTFTNLPGVYFLAQDLHSHVVLSLEHELHLVQDEVNFIFVFHTAIGFNLDFLDHLAGLVQLTVLFIHLYKPLCAACVLAFSEHSAFSSLADSG